MDSGALWAAIIGLSFGPLSFALRKSTAKAADQNRVPGQISVHTQELLITIISLGMTASGAGALVLLLVQ